MDESNANSTRRASESSPARPRIAWIGVKWCITLLFPALGFLFLFSLKYGVTWSSPKLAYDVGLFTGAIYFSEWNPDFLATTSSPPQPGWSGLATYGGDPSIDWLPRFETTRMGASFILPIWIPAIVAGAIAAVFWCRQRRATAAFLRGVAVRLQPAHPLRIRVWAVLTAAFGVFIFGMFVLVCIAALPSAYSRHSGYSVNRWFQTWVSRTFTYGCPIFGYLIVWRWVRFRNRLLFSSGNVCRQCGYNLTGNVSGTCPECGAANTGDGGSNSRCGFNRNKG